MKNNNRKITWRELAIAFLIVLILVSGFLIYAEIKLYKFGEWICHKECPKKYDSYFVGFEMSLDGSQMSYRCGNCVYGKGEEGYVK